MTPRLHSHTRSTTATSSQPPQPPHYLSHSPIIVIQNGWRRLEHEKVLAPAPAEESGAGLARGKESGKYPASVIPQLLLITSHSSKRKRNLTSFERKRRKSVSYKSFSDCRKNKRGRNGRKNWNGCIQHQRRGIVKILTIWRTICWGKRESTKC